MSKEALHQMVKGFLEANKTIYDISMLITKKPNEELTDSDRAIGEVLLKYFEWVTSLEPLPGADNADQRLELPPDIVAGLNELEERFHAASEPPPPSARWI